MVKIVCTFSHTANKTIKITSESPMDITPFCKREQIDRTKTALAGIRVGTPTSIIPQKNPPVKGDFCRRFSKKG
jgi:hypothetical protein